ncbi:hypothetical protein DY000_02042102 [Brassica cretica]|uniref:Zinc knuckle CX2CX4HX4C domain-containing protein n=1 Tax=Brassica cretica TaxID=69181 RepID=A0ABQ7BLE5_BRACR|nr:hypothetical protein DY000_02042102 [Brassica cretica]
MVLRGESPDRGNRGLDLEKDIIRIPECDMTAMAERFKLTLIGPKALGTKMAIDATSARIQISVNIDKPLQFEGTVGFPNGDTGKVTFLYVGLHRYCFTCKMISHDENSCPELTEAQREQKRLQRLALNSPGAQRQLPAHDPGQDRKQGNKRPHSSSLDLHRQSPPRKVQTAKLMLLMGETSESSRHGVWSRLDKEYPIPRVIRRDESAGIRSNTQHMSREQRQDYIPHADITRGKGENISREFNGSRQQEWRPRVSQSYTSDRTRDSHKDQVFVPRETNRSTPMLTGVDQDDTDSQRTISEHPRIFTNNGTQGSGHLVVHRNETEEEKRRRLKGKAIMAPLDATPMSKAKDATSSAILIGRNTIIIGDQPSFRPTSQRALIGQTAESAQGRQNASSERATIIDTATREEGILDDDMLTEEQAKQVTMTAEDEAEVDRLVSEFGDVIMDENMMENDDLLVDEPGFDAEKIDAISQLSPMQSPMQVQNEPDEAMGPKNPSSHRHEKAQRAEHENKKHVALAQPMLEVPLDMIATDKGVAKKKPASSADVKAARASKKLAAQRGRASPKKARGSGIPKKSASHKVPRIEVLKYHMEFLETFGYIWSSRESDLDRATYRGRSRFYRETPLPERHEEVARVSIARHPSQSDLPERSYKVARVSMARRHPTKPGATSQSDPLRSLPKAGATCRSDMPRSLRVYLPVELMFF